MKILKVLHLISFASKLSTILQTYFSDMTSNSSARSEFHAPITMRLQEDSIEEQIRKLKENINALVAASEFVQADVLKKRV